LEIRENIHIKEMMEKAIFQMFIDPKNSSRCRELSERERDDVTTAIDL
jgi:hypothetical protein